MLMSKRCCGGRYHNRALDILVDEAKEETGCEEGVLAREGDGRRYWA